MREFFDDAYAMLAMKPVSERAITEDKIKQSLVQQFIGRFTNSAAEKVGKDKEEVKLYALIFISLAILSHNVRQRQEQNRPFADLIEAGNKELARFSKKLPVKFEIVK